MRQTHCHGQMHKEEAPDIDDPSKWKVCGTEIRLLIQHCVGGDLTVCLPSTHYTDTILEATRLVCHLVSRIPVKKKI